MHNEEFVIHSSEKHTTHELINSKFWPWIKLNFDQYGYIVTMPSCSGRQENMILRYVQQLEDENSSWSKLKLLTFDDTHEAVGTNIRPHKIWKHERCPDIFRRLLKRKYPEAPVAAWFDLTGGLLNQRLLDLQACISKMFAHGSIMFITLAIDNVRGLSAENYIRAVYDYNDREGKMSRAEATEAILIKMVEKLGNKYMVPCCEPYVYKHGRTTYGVFGYLIGKY